jgi:DNA-binding NarL/FixJ family response regulator
MIHTAIIHPHAVYRESLALLLSREIKDLKIVAVSSSLRQLIDISPNLTVDIIVWDILSHHSLSPGARLLIDCFPLAKILVLIGSRNPVYAGLLETLGANAVLPVDCEIREIRETIYRLHETYSPPASSNHVQEPSIELSILLSEFETRLIRHLAKGKGVDDISQKLGLDRSVIHRQCERLIEKINASKNEELVDKEYDLKTSTEPK